LKLNPKEYYLLTIHRAENTDNYDRLKNILLAIAQFRRKAVFPIHPRTRSRIKEFNLDKYLDNENILLIDPVGYLDMISLEKNAFAIFTDSGGVQKEAFWLRVPCITLRDETEWIETVKYGWNTLVGANIEKILEAERNIKEGDYVDFSDYYSAPKMKEVVIKEIS